MVSSNSAVSLEQPNAKAALRVILKEVGPRTTAQGPEVGRRPQLPRTGLFAVTICGFCSFLNLYATQPMLPQLARYFHASQGDVSLTVSAASLAVAIAAPFIGRMSDRIGRKNIIVPAIFLLVIPTILAGISQEVWQLVAFRFVQGLIIPAVFAVVMAYVAEEWQEHGIGFAMAMLVSGNVLGGFAGRLISGLVSAQIGWRQAFFVLAAINLVGGLIAWFLLPASKKFKRIASHDDFWHSAATLMKNRRLVASFAVGANILFSLVAAFTYVTFHLNQAPFNLDARSLSYLFTVYLFGAIVVPFAGRLIDRVGFRTTLLGALSLSAAGIALTLIPSIPTILIGLATTSAALFICQSATTTSLREFAPNANSSATGLYVFFYYAGGSLGGYLPSFLWSVGGWSACVALILACHFIATAAAFLFWRGLPLRSAQKLARAS
jgi:YNFM family putative membrane transporter